MIDSHRVGYNHPISNRREGNNCFIKNNQEIFVTAWCVHFAKKTKKQKTSRQFNGRYSAGMVQLTVILRARVGYEMIDSQRRAQRRVGYNHLIQLFRQ